MKEIALFFDTETSALCDWKSPHHAAHQPDIIQLAYILSTADEILVEEKMLIDPTACNPGWQMDPGAEAVHGISRQMLLELGVSTRTAMMGFSQCMARADVLVCHNTKFDVKLVSTALHRVNGQHTLERFRAMNSYCTMQKSTRLCNIPGKFGPKWPKLSELYPFLFGEMFDGAHDALEDVRATRRAYYELKRRGL
jgi:DNA polymerase III epsilon subunit-like protein